MNELDINYNEIEDLDYCIELLNKKDKEIERLNSIIKEAREYIENHNKVIRENTMLGEYANFMIIPKELKEILDKVEENNGTKIL